MGKSQFAAIEKSNECDIPKTASSHSRGAPSFPVFGTDLPQMGQTAREIERVLREVPGTSSAYAERVVDGYYLDIVPDRDALTA